MELGNNKRCFLFLKAIGAAEHGFSLLFHYIEFPVKAEYLENGFLKQILFKKAYKNQEQN